MEQQPLDFSRLIAIGIALATMLFGYAFGLYEGRGQGYKRRKAEEEDEKQTKPQPMPKQVKVDDPGLLRLKEEEGTLRLDMDGQRVNVPALDVNQRKRLIELLTVMRPWLEGKPSAPPPPAPKLAAPPSTVSAPARSSVPIPDEILNPPPPPVEPVRPIIRFGGAPKKEVAPPKSMIQQIDEILQMRLENTPLAVRGINLTEAPGGGVVVTVGDKKFFAIDEVTDAQAQAAIRAAVAEWEKKSTPGMK